MPKHLGGRGRKAPYETTHVRVPMPIKAEVQQLIDAFYSEETVEPVKTLTGLDDAIDTARSLLKQKKSARVSIINLLTSIYGQNVEL